MTAQQHRSLVTGAASPEPTGRRSRGRGRALVTLVGLVACAFSVAGCARDHPAPPPEPPAEVRAEWARRGGGFGWLMLDEGAGTLEVVEKRPETGAYLPAFSMESCTGSVLRELPDPGVPFGLHIRSQEISQACTSELGRFSNLQALRLGPGRVVPEAIRPLNRIGSLVWLCLSLTDLDDRGGAYLGGCHVLRWLYLQGTRVGDVTARSLQNLGELRVLNLAGTRVSDEGCRFLGRLTRLERLTLAGTQVSDVGLQYLEPLTELRWLNVQGTRVTEEGVRAFRRSHPECEVFGP